MILDDKRPERKQEMEKAEALEREAHKKKVEARNAVIPEIKLISDWRVEQKYNEAINSQLLFVHQIVPTKKRFLEEAIKNRQQIKKLIIEDHQDNSSHEKRGYNISIETDEKTIAALSEEACKLKLSLEAYVRAVFYSAAFEINETKRRHEEEQKKQMEANACVDIGRGRKIGPELRRKLEEKFGKPRFNNLFGIATYNHVDMLLDLAKEYFGI